MIHVDELTAESLDNYIQKKEFTIYLQPQYSVSQNKIVGAEALARWIHEGTFISPGEFIPALEQKGMVTQLDRYLWECAFSLQSQRQKEGLSIVPISINVSREDFSRVNVYETMSALSRQYDISPEYIHIEITESAFVNNNDTIYDSINKLKSFGFMILLDDFGSGYSALNVLKDIDADVIKLDMKFFDMTEETKVKGRNIIDSVIQMAQLLGLGLIAEGVENSYQLDILKEANCDIIQGFFFYRPMCIADFCKLLDDMHNNAISAQDTKSFSRECYEEAFNLMLEGKYEDALTLAKRILTQISPKTDAKLFCELENLLGIIYSGTGNEMMSLEHYLSGLSVAVENDISTVSARIYNNIGMAYLVLGDFRHSIDFFENSLNEQKKNIDTPHYAMLAFKTNLNLCVCYTKLNEYEEAEKYLDQARAFLEYPDVSSIRFHFLSIESELFMKTGRQDYVRKNYPALTEMILNLENAFNYWDNFERLGNIALELKDYTTLKRIIDNMQKQFEQIPEEMIELDILVVIQEFRLAYYEEIDDQTALRQEEHAYVKLCKKMCQRTWKDRATTIDYKIGLKKEFERNASQRKHIDIDELTLAGNRYKLEKDYKLLQQNTSSMDATIGIGIIDLDHFKDINDNYGHLQGDHYLKTISQIIRNTIRGSGALYRYGGDEFVVLLVDVNKSKTEQIAQQILTATENKQLRNQASDNNIQTVSQGYIVVDQFNNTDIWQLISYADRQLYAVQNNGKHDFMILDKTHPVMGH